MSILKKLGILVVVALLLTACGSKTVDPDTAGSSVDTTEIENAEDSTESELEKIVLNTDYSENSISVVLQLLVGSLSIEETEEAINSDMAEDLLPYWKMYKTLAESDTSAPEEMEAVTDQIQEIMTSEQLSYIAGLELDQEAMVALMNDLAIFESLKSGGMGDGDSTGIDRPEGVVPGTGGGQGGGTGSVDPELIATRQAAKLEDSGKSRLTIPLLEALISLLEEKISS